MSALTIAAIQRLEAHLLQLPQADLDTTHAVHGGLYVRQIMIPAGTVMTGATHCIPHCSVMIYGDMTVSTPAGMERVVGPRLWLAPAGTKRVGYAHADTLWLTVHRCDSTTPEAAERELFGEQDLINRRAIAA